MQMIAELLRGWEYFDPAEYAAAILPNVDVGSSDVEIPDPSTRLRYADHFKSISISIMGMNGFRSANLDVAKISLPNVRRLVLHGVRIYSSRLAAIMDESSDLGRLLYLVRGDRVIIRQTSDLAEIRELEKLLMGYEEFNSFALFDRFFPNLLELSVKDYPFRDLDALSPLNTVESLQLFDCDRLAGLYGISRWQNLRRLSLAGAGVPDLSTIPRSFVLDELALSVDPNSAVDLSALSATPREIYIRHCAEVLARPAVLHGQGLDLHVCIHQPVDVKDGVNVLRDVFCGHAN
jgi:hypothetical protein